MNPLAQDLKKLDLLVVDTEPYERDESGCGTYPPNAAVQARDAREVQKVLQYSRQHKVPVVPRGAGSGKSGGALAERGGIVLSLEKMDRIVEVSRADMVCVVEPGVILEKLQAAVEEQGAATQEISRNVQQAAQGTMQVSSNITDVQRGASETGSASSQVLSAAKMLSGDSNRLKAEVSNFLNSVRAA